MAMIDQNDNEPLKKIDSNYYEMVRLVFINDFNISLADAATYISNTEGYVQANYSTLRSIKSRNSVAWQKRNTEKSIKSKTIKKANAIALKENKKNAAALQQDATQQPNFPKKGRNSVATKGEKSNATQSKDVADSGNPKKRNLSRVSRANKEDEKGIVEVLETRRNDNTDPIHDNETIDLRAKILARQRNDLETLNSHIIQNVGRANNAVSKLEGILNLVIDNPLVTDHSAAPEDKAMVAKILEDNPLIKALNALLRNAKTAIYATTEAMRGIGAIQTAERIAWDLDNFNTTDDDVIDDKAEDEHYAELEKAAIQNKIEMQARSARLRQVSDAIEHKSAEKEPQDFDIEA